MNSYSAKRSTLIENIAQKSIDLHCHGIGRFDFTDIGELHLQEIEDTLANRGHSSVLTLYLPKHHFENFLNMMEVFKNAKQSGRLSHIVGIALEGPVLSSHGGTPGASVWRPDRHQWKDIAACGNNGLLYVILSPDAETRGGPSIKWITETLLDGCVLPAPGHFLKTDPVASARALQSLLDQVACWGKCPTVTDHLFNDMPSHIKYAWRTPDDRAKRGQDLAKMRLDTWNPNHIEDQLGPVPATLIRAAWKGTTKICQNFDGEHVDLAIAKRAVELIGADNMLMMTDSIESRRLGGQSLQMRRGSTLLYQEQGIVAAGSQSVRRQITNMLATGLSLEQISMITNWVPQELISTRDRLLNLDCSNTIQARANCA